MAERRMFAKTIVLSDAFLDMPMSARCLYFTLNMFADDDGFVGSPKGIMRQCGASEDDMKLLIAKKFLLSFESGVIVIKHWRIHNYIQNDRKKDTAYLDEKAQLQVKADKSYTWAENPLDTNCIQNVSKMDTQVRLGKDRLGKDSIEEAVNDGNGFMTPPVPLQPVQMTDIDQIIEAWNKQNCTRNINRIPFASQRYNNTMICVNNDLAQFLLTIGELDKQEWLAERARETLLSFDWFVNPTNYQKVVEGNYRTLREAKNKSKAENTNFNNFQQRENDWSAIEKTLLAK